MSRLTRLQTGLRLHRYWQQRYKDFMKEYEGLLRTVKSPRKILERVG